jgi:hypothetical protein
MGTLDVVSSAHRPDRCPECGCTSHWKVRGERCRDCGHPAHPGEPPEPGGRRRVPAARIEPDRSAAILLAVGGLVLFLSVGGPEYEAPGLAGQSGIGFSRDSTLALGTVVGLGSMVAAFLALRIVNRIPPSLVAFGSLLALAAVARDIHDYEAVDTLRPTGFLIAFVAGAVLALVGAVRQAFWAVRRGG